MADISETGLSFAGQQAVRLSLPPFRALAFSTFRGSPDAVPERHRSDEADRGRAPSYRRSSSMSGPAGRFAGPASMSPWLAAMGYDSFDEKNRATCDALKNATRG